MNVVEVDIEDVCKVEKSAKVYFTSPFDLWEECMLFCPKLNRARVPKVETSEDKEAMKKWLYDTVIDRRFFIFRNDIF